MSSRKWCFFHNETGELHERLFTSTDAFMLAANTPAGHTAIEGVYDHVLQQVDVSTGKVVQRATPKAPITPRHVWEPRSRRWMLREHAEALQ